MKLFATFVACVCLVQMCLGAPTGDSSSSESSEFLTDADIEEMRSDLKDVPGIDPKSLDDFVNTMSKFRKNSTDEEAAEGVFELLALAMKEPCEPKVDLKKILDSFDDESKESEESKKSDESKADSSSSDELSEDELKALDEGLTPLVSPKQKTRAMRFLRAFRKGATEDEKASAILQLSMAAVLSLRNTCELNKTGTNTL